MSNPYVLEKDLREVVALAENLEPYVRGRELYGNAGGAFGSLPSLTVGAVLLRLRRLHALHGQLNDSQRASLERAQQHYQQTKKTWRVHWQEKALREANSRLDAMRAFFQECANSARACANNYLPEVLRRTIVQELLIELEAEKVFDAQLDEKRKHTDGKLRGLLRPCPFIWAEVLQPVYPSETFWWLYQRPPQP